MLTVLGVCALTFMVACYAFENRGRHFTIGFALGCALSSVYGFLIGAWPFGVVEAVWCLVAIRRSVPTVMNQAAAGDRPLGDAGGTGPQNTCQPAGGESARLTSTVRGGVEDRTCCFGDQPLVPADEGPTGVVRPADHAVGNVDKEELEQPGSVDVVRRDRGARWSKAVVSAFHARSARSRYLGWPPVRQQIGAAHLG